MELELLLRKKKKDLVQRWFQAVVETYSADASRFFMNNKDPFANPVGSAFREGLSGLLDLLLTTQEQDPQKILACLDPMIRIRAVQNFLPSEAVGFLFHLKKILREHRDDALPDTKKALEYAEIENRIDVFVLHAFNLYMQCKEKIYQLKSNEIRSRTFQAFERAGLVCEIPRIDPDIDNYH